MKPQSHASNLIFSVVRIVMALVFILSGFLKAVDPWGAAIKTAEYFHAFGMGWLDGSQYFFSILQSGLELWLGLLLLFNLSRKTAPLLTMAFLIFFTGLTLYIAVANPISDCGCFGDAIKLTNWETFVKNVILLPLSVLLFIRSRGQMAPARASRLALSTLLLAIALLPGLTSLSTLPWIDFLPYKVGVNIPKEMAVPAGESQGEHKTTLIYMDRQTGENREFEVSDTTWYDSERWEYVDTHTETIREAYVPAIGDFRIFGPDGDLTGEVLAEEEVFLFIAHDLDRLDVKDGERIAGAAGFAEKNGIRAICLTTSPLDKSGKVKQVSGYDIPVYNMDGTTMKTLIRAHKGLVVLQKGTILAKRNLRCVPDMNRSESPTAVSYFTGKYHDRLRNTGISIYAVLIAGLLVGRCRCRKVY